MGSDPFLLIRCVLARRAGRIAIGTEHATIARLGLEQNATGGTVVEILAGVRRHGLGRARAARRAGQGRLELRGVLSRHRRVLINESAQGSIRGRQASARTDSAVAVESSAIEWRDGGAHEASVAQRFRLRHMLRQAAAKMMTAPNVSQVRCSAKSAIPAKLKPINERPIGSTQQADQANTASAAAPMADQPNRVPGDRDRGLVLDDTGSLSCRWMLVCNP